MKYVFLSIIALLFLNACKSSVKINQNKLPITQVEVEVKEKKFVFDQSDKEALDICGAEEAISTLIKHQAKKIENPFEIFVTDIRMPLNDPLSVENYYVNLQPEYLDKKIQDFVQQPPVKQKVDHQAYWIFSSQMKKATEHKLILRQSTESISSMVKYTLIIKGYDLSKNEIEKSYEGGIVTYKVAHTHPSPSGTMQYSLNLDSLSSHWFKVTADRIAVCMEEKNLASNGSSRDSIQAYLAFTLFEPRISKIQAALTAQHGLLNN